jgi:hypothetical protein
MQAAEDAAQGVNKGQVVKKKSVQTMFRPSRPAKKRLMKVGGIKF